MSLRARLLGAFAYVLVLAIVAFGVPLALSLSARVNAEVRTAAQSQADLVAATAGDLLGPRHRAELTALVATAATSLRGRVLIVDVHGRVLADSAGPAEIGASYVSRPEIAGALAGRQVQVQRTSRTLDQRILATAVPIVHDGRSSGAVRVTQSVAAVRQAVLRTVLALALIGGVVLALGLLAAAVLARQIGRPVRRLEAIARRVARGDLTARAAVEGSREQRSLSESFNEMTGRIRRLLDAQQDFVADASHQLRTPLTGLRLRLEEALALNDSAPAAREIRAAIGEVDRLSEMVDELLTLSRAGERPASGTELILAELVRATRLRWTSEATRREIALQERCDGEPTAVWASRADIERALDALVENALRYSPPGSTVTIASRPGRIEISDRGAGIGEDERDLVFERFRRGRAARAVPQGTGLGLPIARELVRAWGGDIRLVARAGGGTTAVLDLGGPAPTEPAAPENFARA